MTYIFLYKINVLLNLHQFDRDESDGEEMDFDAFISYAQDDYQTALNILELIECNIYKFSINNRDFKLGETIDNNICESVARSRRTVCVESENFISSVFCMREFDVAFHRNIVMRKKRLIAVVVEPVDELWNAGRQDELASLKQFLRSHTYVDYNSDDYKQRLLIIIIMLAYFYCDTYIRMKTNKSSINCDRRSHYKKSYRS